MLPRYPGPAIRVRGALMQGQRAPAREYADPACRASLMRLLDDAWPSLSARIDRAASAGFAWDQITEPFVAWEDGEAVAHVGVLEHRARVGGQDHAIAGFHAVCTRSDRRGRGLARETLARAVAWADERYALCKLGTDVPAIYAPHGFRALPLHRFHLARAGGSGGARGLSPAEQPWFLETCAGREPVSDRFASLDPGWLVGIDLALQRRTIADLWVVGEAIVDWELDGDALVLHEVIARRLPTLDALLGAAPPHCRVILMFCPDKLAPDAEPESLADAGVWMARGPWPDTGPLAVGRLAEH